MERNPRGQVPTLEVEGGSNFESNAICRYLCNEALSALTAATASARPLYPRDPTTRALVDCWLDLDCELFLTVKDVFDLTLGFKKGD